MRRRNIIIALIFSVTTIASVLLLDGHFPYYTISTNTISTNSTYSFSLPSRDRLLDHSTLQTNIDLANGYIDSLYKDNYPNEVGYPNEAIISEYPSYPLTIKLPDGTLIRAGDDAKIIRILSPITSILFPVTSISNPHNTRYDTNYDLTFRKGGQFISIADIVVLHVVINHNYWTGSTYGTKMTVIQKSFDGDAQSIPYVNVYLGSSYIGQADPNRNGNTLGNYIYTGNNDRALRSIRYTERHSTELGYEWYLATANLSKANKISNELANEGYQLHNDIYSPLFRTDTKLADDYLYRSGPNGVYRDCYQEPSLKQNAYQYHSKVCTFGVDFYIWYSRNYDTLGPALWAIHIINIYHNPDTKYYDGDSWKSPREIARSIEKKWINIGIQSPYDNSVASSVRTAVFDVLETVLGYRYNDPISRSFADKATQVIQIAQVKGDGVISQYDISSGTTEQYERSNVIGGFYTSWKESFTYVATISKIKQILEWLFNHPDENGDIKPSNAETTFTSAQALRVYDCYRHKHNCISTP